jgi:prolipoprotein diacylglyceryl transferase
MPRASLPSPVDGLWRLGPVRLHGYALCVVLGVVALLWLAERRYRAVGGRPWLIVDMATMAVPAALLGARLYLVITDYQAYFGRGRDWVNIWRISGGGLGLPGAVVVGVAVAWIWCHREGVAFGPVLGAAAPGLMIGQAIGLIGNWFSQGLYGQPSTWPWAIAISPWHRVPSYQNYSTFQPLFGYEALWDVVVALALIRLIRSLSLTGDRALALCLALYSAGRFTTATLQLTSAHQRSGVRLEQAAAIAVILGACAYLYVTRARRGPEALLAGPPRGPLRGDPGARPRTDTAARGEADHRSASSMDRRAGPGTWGSGGRPGQIQPTQATSRGGSGGSAPG